MCAQELIGACGWSGRDKARKRERLVGACVLKFYYPDAESWTEKEREEEERGERERERGEEECEGTNRKNKGLISADRSNKATLLLTIPRSVLSRLQRIYLPSIWNCYRTGLEDRFRAPRKLSGMI